MAREFKKSNPAAVQSRFAKAFGDIPVRFEPHLDFKKRVPAAVGLIRTGDTIPYTNMILVSG
jgi:D-ribose pyranase